ncbi:SulP family inorganic anion transporter [Nocardioides sp. T2.26MG-1]|uniref:SulP family inorganic anion transporter n=1 Tax=Nocardioides sp. T2.26MG-1 TaxID=3041166 RepID=UPI0024772F6A|nr:sulfate permease [Nocardioides sp. T2.26MG-1]CAI9414275.1 putative sulfate transporter [Nocardioides sp. T2.26MG-1]
MSRSDVSRQLPGLTRLRHYQRPWLRYDVLAGVTVAAYLIPQVMAYAEIAGLPPVVGLWAIIGPLLVYAVLGSSRQLSVGPESTTALMTAAAVGSVAAGDPERYAAIAAALSLVVGAICLGGWIGRLGFLADLLSKPVLVGYMAGIAAIMVASQLGKVTGVRVDADSFATEVAYVARHLDEVHVPTTVLAVTVLALLLTGSHLLPRSPMPLLGMLAAAAVVALFDLEDRGIAVVGEIPAGLPRPSLPSVSAGDIGSILLPAVGLAIVAYSDNVLTARTFAVRNGYPIDGDQEFLALGAANLASGVMHGFPVSSSGSRTVIGDALGSRSQLYSLVALATVLLTMVFLRPVLASFPTAALGAIVVYAAIRLVDVAEFRRIARFRRSELLLALTTTVAVLALDVLYGVLVAIGLSILDLLRRVARPHDGILGFAPGVAGMHDIDDYPDAQAVQGLVVYRYDSPLFFANVEDFKRRALAALDQAGTPTEWFLLNAEANVQVDITAIDALEELRQELESRGIVFAMARVKQDLQDDLRPSGFVDRLGEDRVFMTLPTAVQAYARWYEAKHGTTPYGAPPAA